VAGQFDFKSTNTKETVLPFHLARLFKARLKLPADRPTLVSYTLRSSTLDAAIDLVLELSDGSCVELASSTGGEKHRVVPASVDSLHDWNRLVYVLPPDLNGKLITGLALRSYLAHSANGLVKFEALIGEICIHSPLHGVAPSLTKEEPFLFPRPPAVRNLKGRAVWTIASLNPQLLNSEPVEVNQHGGRVQVASVWLTWDRPCSEVCSRPI